jgi:TP901 family phage tail tape measure protein
MPSVRLRVGATKDRSIDKVFGEFEARARKCRKAIEGDFGAMGTALGARLTKGTATAVKQLWHMEAQAKRVARGIESPFAMAALGISKSTRLAADAAERDFVRMEQAASRSSGIMSRAFRGPMGRSVLVGGGGSLLGPGGRAAMGMARGARNIAMGVARGAGVDLNLGSLANKNIELETGMVQLSNSAYMPARAGKGLGANNFRQDPKALMAEARRVADATGFETNAVAEGLQKFVGKTGDLATGREVLPDMAKLAKASGSSLEDMVDAAGDVANALGDIPNKGKAIDTVMRGVAGQGKLGAVEIRNLSSQMAKVVAASSKFGGDAGENILKMGMLAQEARGAGGAASATQAATSAMAFANTLSTPARIKAFKNIGINVFDKKGMLRDPQQIILESLQKTKGNPEEMKKLFANVMGERAVTSYATTFRRAGGGDEGTKAVEAKFADLLEGAAMTQAEVNDSFRTSMDTTASRIQLFNNTMQETTGQIQSALAPALVALAPMLISAAHAAGDFIVSLTGKKEADIQKDAIAGELSSANVHMRAKHGKASRSEVESAIAKTEEQIDVTKGRFDLGKRTFGEKAQGALGAIFAPEEARLMEQKRYQILTDELRRQTEYLRLLHEDKSRIPPAKPPDPNKGAPPHR